MTRVMRNFSHFRSILALALDGPFVLLVFWQTKRALHTDNVFSMGMMGVMTSMGRAVSAILAAAIVSASGRKAKNLNAGRISLRCYM